MKAPPFRYIRPRTLDELFDLLEAHGDDARVLAGGQSLLATLNLRLSAPAVLLDIGALPLSGIREMEAGAGVEIGALTTHREVEHSALVATRLPLLAMAMPHVAHVAIRNRGTMGGSLALADPAAEWPALVVALQARIVVQGRNGRRVIPAQAFFLGLYETALQPDEIIVAVHFDATHTRTRCHFDELARRHGDYAAAGIAAVAPADEATWRLVFFGVGTTPVPVDVASPRNGARSDAAHWQREVIDSVDGHLDPAADLHFSTEAKRHLAETLTQRALAALAGDLSHA